MVIGASLAPDVDVRWLGETLLAFFLAMGLAAHALDELHGRPLRTRIPDAALVAVAVVGLAGAVALGIDGMIEVSPWLGVFIAVGAFLVVAYNLELFGGVFHSDLWFALAWGAFPVLTAYFAQTAELGVAALLAAAAMCGPERRPTGAVDAGQAPAAARRGRARRDDPRRRDPRAGRRIDPAGGPRVRAAAAVARGAAPRGGTARRTAALIRAYPDDTIANTSSA